MYPTRTSSPPLKPQWLSTESYGLVIMLISAMLFSAIGCFVKIAVDAGIPSTQVIFLRAIFQLTVAIAFMAPSSLLRHPFGKSLPVIKIVIARGVVGAFGFVLYFYSISCIPLGDSITLFSLYPAFTLFMARIFLGENMEWRQVIAAVFSLIGGALIAGPSFLSLNNDANIRKLLQDDLSNIARAIAVVTNNYNPLGYVAAILGSFCASSIIILIRKAGTMNVHTLQLIFSWGLFSAMLSSLVGMSSYVRDHILGEEPWILHIPSREAGICVLLICVTGAINQFLMNFGGKLAPAGLASIARSSDILWAYGWQVSIFRKIPIPTTILGAFMVLISLCLVATAQIGVGGNRKDVEEGGLIDRPDDECLENENTQLRESLSNDISYDAIIEENK